MTFINKYFLTRNRREYERRSVVFQAINQLRFMDQQALVPLNELPDAGGNPSKRYVHTQQDSNDAIILISLILTPKDEVKLKPPPEELIKLFVKPIVSMLKACKNVHEIKECVLPLRRESHVPSPLIDPFQVRQCCK